MTEVLLRLLPRVFFFVKNLHGTILHRLKSQIYYHWIGKELLFDWFHRFIGVEMHNIDLSRTVKVWRKLTTSAVLRLFMPSHDLGTREVNDFILPITLSQPHVPFEVTDEFSGQMRSGIKTYANAAIRDATTTVGTSDLSTMLATITEQRCVDP